MVSVTHHYEPHPYFDAQPTLLPSNSLIIAHVSGHQTAFPFQISLHFQTTNPHECLPVVPKIQDAEYGRVERRVLEVTLRQDGDEVILNGHKIRSEEHQTSVSESFQSICG